MASENEGAAPAAGAPLSAADYWETRYREGGSSGAGSRRHLARYKNAFLNRFVLANRIHSVMELGCGDGRQLVHAIYPAYYGVDVAPEAVAMCQRLFEREKRRRFFTLDQLAEVPEVDMAMSLDVVYHLLSAADYRAHLRQLFGKARSWVVIYGNDIVRPYKAKHVILHDVFGDIARDYPEWELVQFERNPFYSEVGNDPTRTWANFQVYRRRPDTAEGWAIEASDPAVAALPVPPEALDTPASPTFWADQPAEAVFAVPRSAETLAAMLDLLRGGHARDVTGWVTDAVARDHHFYLAPPRRPRIVVSLTTIASRIADVHRVIETVWRGSILPDEVVLNLSEEAHLLDEGVKPADLPKPIIKLQSRGLLRINWVPNTGPYRKILDVLREERDARTIIVTIDDDVLLPRDWLKLLLREHGRTGGIVAYRGRRMTFASDGRPGRYREWTLVSADAASPVSAGFLPTGKYGVLYPPNAFASCIFDPRLMAAAPGADDLLLKVASTAAGTQSHVVSASAEDRERFDLRFGKVPAPPAAALWDANKKENDGKLLRLIETMEQLGTPRAETVARLAGR